MGTHSLIRMRVNGVTWFGLYQQYDGYPEMVGVELAEWLCGVIVVNGISTGDTSRRIANGPHCLFKQLVGYYYNKSNVGGSYLYPSDQADGFEEWNYNVDYDTDTDEITLTIYDHERRVKHGTPEAMLEWCRKQDKKQKETGELISDDDSSDQEEK